MVSPERSAETPLRTRLLIIGAITAGSIVATEVACMVAPAMKENQRALYPWLIAINTTIAVAGARNTDRFLHSVARRLRTFLPGTQAVNLG